MSIRRSLVWSLSQQINMYILFFVNMVVTARLLTPEEVGIFVVALSANMVLQSMREMGVTHYLIREPEITNAKISTTFMISIAFAGILGLAMFLLRHTIAGIFDSPEVAQVLVIVAITIWIFPLEHPAQALMRREMRFKALHHISISSKLISVVLTIILAMNGFSYMSLAYGMLTEAACRALMIASVENRHLRTRPTTKHWRTILKFGGWTTGASLANTLATEGEKFLAGALLNLAAAGIYDRSSRLPQLLRQALVTSLGRVFISAFAVDVRAGRSIGSKVEALCASTCGVLWPLFFIMSLLAEPLVALLFGPNWGQVATLLPWILAGQAVLALLPQPDQVLVPHGAVRRLFVLRLMQVIVTLSIVTLTAPLGLETFAKATLVGAMIVVSMNWLALRKWIDVSLTRMAQLHLKSAMTSVFTVLPVSVAVLLEGPSYMIITALVLTPVFWLAGLYLTKHILSSEIENARRALRARRA